MFEQSILLDQPAGKRAGALAASFTAQVAGVGVLILIPLIYNDRLPDIRPWTTLTIPLPPPEPAPPPIEQAAPMQAPTRIPTRVLQLPVHEPQPLASSSATWGEPPSGVVGLPPVLPLSSMLLPHVFELPRPAVLPVEVSKVIPDKPIEVGGKVQEAKLVRRVMPVYPALARQARVSGTVHLMAVIAKDGTIIRDLQPSSAGIRC